MIVTQRERERGRDTGGGRSRLHAQGAWCGIRSRVSRIAPWAKGRRQTAAPPRDPRKSNLNPEFAKLVFDGGSPADTADLRFGKIPLGIRPSSWLSREQAFAGTQSKWSCEKLEFLLLPPREQWAVRTKRTFQVTRTIFYSIHAYPHLHLEFSIILTINFNIQSPPLASHQKWYFLALILTRALRCKCFIIIEYKGRQGIWSPKSHLKLQWCERLKNPPFQPFL